MLHNNVTNFFDFGRKKAANVDEFVFGFHLRMVKINKFELNKKLKSHLLLRQANLDVHDRNVVIKSAGGSHSLQFEAASLRKVYRSEGLHAASMTTVSQSRSYSTHPKSVESVRSDHNSSSTNACGDPLLCTYLSVNRNNQVPSAIIDTSSCGSVMEQNLSGEAVALPGVKELKDE